MLKPANSFLVQCCALMVVNNKRGKHAHHILLQIISFTNFTNTFTIDESMSFAAWI